MLFVQAMHKFYFLLFFAFPLGVFAQEEAKPLHYWRKPDSLLFEQAALTYQLVDQLLNEHPPALHHPLARKSALMHLDALWHDPRLDGSAPFHRFIRQRVEVALAELGKPLESGMKIFKFYNHGFVVKTKAVTLAFDLHRGGTAQSGPFIPDSLMQQVIARCDVLFVSHEHADHADPEVGRMFTRSKKTVVVPPGLWEDLGGGIQALRSEGFARAPVRLPNGKVLQVAALPGHQDKTVNNMYAVTTPEGLTVAHTGDQWSETDRVWMADIHKHMAIDVLLVHCWAVPLESFIAGFAPKLVITGHENEMTHGIDHREPYWLSAYRMKNVNLPKLYMTWGEWYHYMDPNPLPSP